MKVVFSSNISWSIYNFRRSLLNSLQSEGHTIHAVASRDDYSEKLVEENFIYHEIKINNNSTNPVEDVKLIIQYYKIYKKINPDVICHNAIKPNIYGTIAAKLLGIPVVNNISGLGTLFIKKSFSTSIAKFLYKVSQRRADKVFFQNPTDFREFKENKLIKPERCEVIPGSGVDTDTFVPNKNQRKGPFQFIFIGRLIFDKGIREYIEALRILKQKNSDIEGAILGPIYHSNKTAITQEDLDNWIKEGIINYLGETDHVVDFMQKADCLVLPSYREGLSKVLIEGSSVGLPIVTTDVPGCRDVVVDKETGYLSRVKDGKDLAGKMQWILDLSDSDRKKMGEKARERAVNTFDNKIIIKQYKDAIYGVA